MGHTGVKQGRFEPDKALVKRLALAIALSALVFFAELIGGYLTNSLALMSDAAHVFMDVFTLSLSLFAIYISRMPPTETRTYGLHRVEVFVSFINGITLLLVAAFILYKAYGRLLSPEKVESSGMLLVALIGLAVNLFVAVWLRGFAGHDLNIKSAYFHVIGDALGSVGVIIASIVISLTGWHLVDPIISLPIGGILLYGVYHVLRDSSHILLEGVPKDVDLNTVVREIKSQAGVTSVHSLHIWSICHNVYALSAHLDIEPLQRGRMGEILGEINTRLAENHHIFYTTLQAECLGCNPQEMFHGLVHKERGHIH
ncbi:MAG: cation transporter [Deltaproteobacteria bacterium]|nr:cation transporter [Deltaproteobacteria bacterium]